MKVAKLKAIGYGFIVISLRKVKISLKDAKKFRMLNSFMSSNRYNKFKNTTALLSRLSFKHFEPFKPVELISVNCAANRFKE